MEDVARARASAAERFPKYDPFLRKKPKSKNDYMRDLAADLQRLYADCLNRTGESLGEVSLIEAEEGSMSVQCTPPA